VLKTTRQPLSLNALAEKIGVPDQVEIVYKVVRHLTMNQRQVVLHGNLAKPGELSVSLSRKTNQDASNELENMMLRKAS